MTTDTLPNVAKYGVLGIHFGGCFLGSPIHQGQPAAMRRSAHAHNIRKSENFGHICFKAYSPDRILPSLFWHEVGHIYRPSWTEEKCNKFGRSMARKKEGVRC